MSIFSFSRMITAKMFLLMALIVEADIINDYDENFITHREKESFLENQNSYEAHQFIELANLALSRDSKLAVSYLFEAVKLNYSSSSEVLKVWMDKDLISKESLDVFFYSYQRGFRSA